MNKNKNKVEQVEENNEVEVELEIKQVKTLKTNLKGGLAEGTIRTGSGTSRTCAYELSARGVL